MKPKDIIPKVLKEHGEEIYKLLKEMYPESFHPIIDYHYNGQPQDHHFMEWFAFLFKLTEWDLSGPIIIDFLEVYVSPKARKNLEAKYQAALTEGKKYFNHDFTKPGDYDFDGAPYLTVTKPEGEEEYRIVDGYHRWYLCKKEKTWFKAYEWIKRENTHPNALKIQRLIINNLGK